VGLVVVLVVATVLVIGIGHMVYVDAMENQAHVRERLARRRSVPIAQVQEGLVRWSGRVHLTTEPLTAPVSQRPCVAYQLTIMLGDGEGGWSKVLELTDARPFILADETGRGVVDAMAGPFAIALVPDRKASSSAFRADGADLRSVRALLREQDIPTRTVFGTDQPVKFTEAVLLPGSELSVSGSCTWEIALDGERAGYRELPQRIALRGTAEEPLLLSNWPDAFNEPDWT
jgi:hypothetical protein